MAEAAIRGPAQEGVSRTQPGLHRCCGLGRPFGAGPSPHAPATRPPRTLVLLADGTSCTLDTTGTSSNMRRIIDAVDLRLPRHDGVPPQLAFYDQGVGTSARLGSAALDRAAWSTDHELLKLLPPPRGKGALSRVALVAGLLAGWGLMNDARELLHAIHAHHRPGDRLFLFGYSRGAVTVRTVAAFLYRCGLPQAYGADFTPWFEEHWPHFVRLDDDPAWRERRQRARTVQVDFLGLFDTVKSYGWPWPVGFPHLRHNPLVRVLRHAMAMDERRAWFQVTRWGRADEALTGRPLACDPGYLQSVMEVWFRGGHGDVGGQSGRDDANPALLWMLGEAAARGLRLSDHGLRLLRQADPQRRLDRRSYPDSRGLGFLLLDLLVPRLRLDNKRRPPRRRPEIGPAGQREMQLSMPTLFDARNRRPVLVHRSAFDGARAQWPALPWKPVDTRVP